MQLQSFLIATLVAHVWLAIFVTAHAHLTDEERGNWPLITLFLGIAGVVGYFFYEPGNDRI